MACKTGISAEDILGGELYGVLTKAVGEDDPLETSVVDQAILDAEAFYETDLRIFLAPTRVVSEGPARNLVEGTHYDLSEPAYGYDSELMFEERWGWIDLNYRPVRSIDKFFFALPGATPVLELDPLWIRPDGQFGRVQIVPMRGTNAATLGISAYLMSMFAGGRGLPQSVYIDYTAGFTKAELQGRHRALLHGIRIRAAMNLMPQLSNARTGGLGSASLSMDGLSRSQSFGQGKWGPYSGAIEQWMAQEKEVRRTFEDAEGGVTMAVLGA